MMFVFTCGLVVTLISHASLGSYFSSEYFSNCLQELLGAAAGSPLYCFHLPITLYGFMLRKDIYIYIYLYI